MNKTERAGFWNRQGYRLKVLYRRFRLFAHSEHGKRSGRILSYLVQGFIVIYLVYELTLIGWGRFFAALPLNPLFYLLFLFIYLALPVTEIFAYKQSWPMHFWEGLPIYIKKRVYNKNVFAYSGEVLVYNYARKHDWGEESNLFKVIRDNNIMSSLASTSVVFGLLLLFILSGRIALVNELVAHYDLFTLISALLIVGVLIAVIYHNRHYFFSMPRKIALAVYSFHAVRMVVINFVQILIWYVVMPDISLEIWFTFLSIQLLISRIPFLPNRELFYIGASLEVSHMIDFSAAAIAGLLIAQNALDKLLNLGLFTLISFRESRRENSLLSMQD